MRKITRAVNWLLLFVLIGGLTMARGTPDEGQNLSSMPTTQVSDLGEQATRLLMGGGANSRSGRIIWATGFESGLAEFESNSTTKVAIRTDLAYQGKQCVMLQGTLNNDDINVWKKITTPIIQNTSVVNRFGIETVQSFGIANHPFQWQWIIQHPRIGHLGTQIVLYYVVLDILGNQNGSLNTYDGGYHSFANVSPYLYDDAGLWHYGKMVIDSNQEKIVKFVFDDQTFNLTTNNSGIVLSTPLPGADFPGFMFKLRLFNKSANLVTGFADNLIITADEP